MSVVNPYYTFQCCKAGVRYLTSREVCELLLAVENCCEDGKLLEVLILVYSVFDVKPLLPILSSMNTYSFGQFIGYSKHAGSTIRNAVQQKSIVFNKNFTSGSGYSEIKVDNYYNEAAGNYIEIMTQQPSTVGLYQSKSTTSNSLNTSVRGEANGGCGRIVVDSARDIGQLVNALHPHYYIQLHDSLCTKAVTETDCVSPFEENIVTAGFKRSRDPGDHNTFNNLGLTFPVTDSKKAKSVTIRNTHLLENCISRVSELSQIVPAVNYIDLSKALAMNNFRHKDGKRKLMFFFNNLGMGESLRVRWELILGATQRVIDAIPKYCNKVALILYVESLPSLFISYNAICNAMIQFNMNYFADVMFIAPITLSLTSAGKALNVEILLKAIRSDSSALGKGSLILDLKNSVYQFDKRPLCGVDGSSKIYCPCYTCRSNKDNSDVQHTRAYIYHLLSVNEMNAYTLLAIHNHCGMLRILRALRGVAIKGLKASILASKRALEYFEIN